MKKIVFGLVLSIMLLSVFTACSKEVNSSSNQTSSVFSSSNDPTDEMTSNLEMESQTSINNYQEWASAQNAPEQGDMYDDTRIALEQIKEGLKTGKTGTPKYKASINLLVPEKNKKDVNAYVKTLERYITENVDGLQNFLNDMVSKNLMTKDNDYYEFISAVTMEEIADKFNITLDLTNALIGELEEYGFDFDFSEK